MDLVYVSERKLYGRLGMRPSSVQQGVQATLKVPPFIEVSGNRAWEKAAEPTAPHALVSKAKRIIERRFVPVPFTTRNLQVNQWISFDLAMSQAAVHEDSGRPPEDVALFTGKVSDGAAERPRDLGLMLCGSVQHLRGQVCAQGRMGSGTTWLHDLILEVERREERGVHVIPESLSELMPHRRSDVLIEDAAFAVHGWIERSRPPSTRGRLRGHALVLMDIDRPQWTNRLVVATPLYVEAVHEQMSEPWRRALPWITRRARTP
ncbi:SAVMC3_10250 family protein [Streptomyces pseudovenezuelae]|uniref:SAVMC3_10250 family protein n=1 Tax=Streptomyces pseudovenezuelae TaxID=67350 RepID=UPI002E818570|nr:SAVMC3_10250 family protein [Streptomyces pseudovenezuelae]WUA85858.1 SAVMC3_10250 family protein [Streptomyces pseudovenezuelae]